MTRIPIFDSHQYEVPLGVVTPPPKDLWRLRRWAPKASLDPYVKWAWMAEWNLDEYGPFETTTLPYPATNLVVDGEAITLYGPTTRLFRRRLTGTGATIGILFSPAGFSAFTTVPVGNLVDGAFPTREIFVSAQRELDQLVLDREEPDLVIDTLEHVLDSRRPAGQDSRRLSVDQIVDSIASNPSLTTVDDVASHHHLSRRTLQRLFTNYVGVGVKTVLRRHRLQEIANQALVREDIDWAGLAARLGYSDQAHLIRDFDRTVGTSPARHRKNVFTKRQGPVALSLSEEERHS